MVRRWDSDPSLTRTVVPTDLRSLVHRREFEGFPIPDRGVPASVEATKALSGRLETKIRSGGAVGGEQPLRAAQRYQAR